MAMYEDASGDDVLEGKVIAILSYLSILCIIPLLFKRSNLFVLTHSKQGLVIFVAEVAIFILHIILGMWFLKLGMFILLTLSFIGLLAVLRGQYIQMPIVSSIAEKITL
jgi:fumarate reductase subunit D